jgi:hypothetical protein
VEVILLHESGKGKHRIEVELVGDRGRTFFPDFDPVSGAVFASRLPSARFQYFRLV